MAKAASCNLFKIALCPRQHLNVAHNFIAAPYSRVLLGGASLYLTFPVRIKISAPKGSSRLYLGDLPRAPGSAHFSFVGRFFLQASICLYASAGVFDPPTILSFPKRLPSSLFIPKNSDFSLYPPPVSRKTQNFLRFLPQTLHFYKGFVLTNPLIYDIIY